MQCTSPIRVKSEEKDYIGGLTVPCGKCLSCRISIRRLWTLRCLHELSYHNQNVFVTLTYNDENLPLNKSLRKKHLQDFYKRLRRDLDKQDIKIKHFSCGEYGAPSQLARIGNRVFQTDGDRPHYHAIIFGLGLDPESRLIVAENWPFCDWNNKDIMKNSFGLAQRESIQYVAGYIHDKLSGELAEIEYKQKGREPVFRLVSQGIGKAHCLDNAEQYSDRLFTTLNGRKTSLPRYYIKLLDIDPEELKRFSCDKEKKFVKKHTGIECDIDTALINLDINEDLERIIKDDQLQRSKNVDKRLALQKARK